MTGTTRRDVLIGSGLFGAALMVPVAFGSSRSRAAGAPSLAGNTWLGVDAQGRVTLALPKTEMGQGILTTITMIAAEELAVRPVDVVVSIPDGDSVRFAPIDQGTGGSTSVREVWQPLREAGARARVALVNAGARQWGVPAAECDAHDGAVVHRPSGKVLAYAALVAAAAAAPLPTEAPVRPASAYAVIGKSHRRLDGDAKARGVAEYGIDVVVPGMKYAAISVSPIFGGKLAGVDEAAARAVQGVTGVIRGADVVYVVGDNTWAVRQGITAAKAQWTADAASTGTQQAGVIAAVAAALDKPGFVAATSGDLEAARVGAAHRFSATYTQPFLAHATMEPANCVAHVHDGQCEIWTGSQIPGDARKAAAKRLGLPLDKVTLHNRLMGGGFGRRLEADMVERCVDLAKQVPFPVKLIWSREEDMSHDWYRPAYADHIDIAIGADGKIAAWEHKIAGSSIMARLLGPAFKGVDDDAVEGAITPIYPARARKVTFQQQESLVPTSWWRGVGPLRSAFVMESAIDEVAHQVGADPIAFRLAHIEDPRARRARTGARQGGLGHGGRTRRRARRRGDPLVGYLYGGSRRSDRGQGSPDRGQNRHRGGRLRAGGQSVGRRRADRQRDHLWHRRRALWRSDDRQWPRRTVEFPRLSRAAHERGTGDPHHPDRQPRKARRHGRTPQCGDLPGPGQRGVRRHGQAPAQPAVAKGA